jgi:ferric-dicitrate binding protein FerR (iron transport regulator)
MDRIISVPPDMTSLEELYHRWATGKASAKERELLMQLLALPEHEAQARKLIAEAIEENETNSSLTMSEERLQLILHSIAGEAEVIEEVVTPVRRINIRWLRYAAILVLALGCWLIYKNLRTEKNVQTPADQLAGIQPGRNRAVLTLSDGSIIELDSASHGTLATQGEVLITKTADGDIIYNAKGAENGEVMMNTMSTPRGGQYHLVLPDGTEVWLNAASSIRYPTIFKGENRKVEVTGESFFQVAKDKSKPFIVSLPNNAEIEVLGTSFNVNAYADESSVNTTLVNGAVRVASVTDPAGKVILKPGQQARFAQGNQHKAFTVINNADIDKVTAWKNGQFNFEGTSLEDAMKQLSRWYDVEIVFDKEVYARGLEHTKLVGGIRRDLSLANVLELLNVMGLHFRMEEGRKLIVLP